MAINKVEICGVDTNKLPMLSAKEMRALLLKVKSGDETAREEFIRSNLRLVLSIVQRFGNRNEQMDDLFQVGCIGLIKAIDNFDLRHEVRFSTYAVPMIIGEIRRHLRDNNAIRVSRSLRDTAYKALQARNRLTAASGNEPTLADIAKEIGLPEEDVVFALDAIQEPVSLFEPIFRDDGDAIFVIDQLSDTKTIDANWLDSIAISDGMSHLTEREMRILKLRFFIGKTQMEVSREIGISQAQVSRLEKNALKQLQKFV
ncbi:MAG: RNA polymerase sporulation sigma factor SigG [Clostridia bacterium]